jgi:dTDP-4-dehydrorhamnose 3,5-epimerase
LTISEIAYKTTEYYSPDLDYTIIWSDPSINIQWPKNIKPLVSAKDSNWIALDLSVIF